MERKKAGEVPKPGRMDKRKILFLILAIIIVISLAISMAGYFQTFTEGDLEILHLGYASFENTDYSGWESFCSECGENCSHRLDFEVRFPRFEEWENFPFEREYHCVEIVDGVNQFDEKGIYYGVTDKEFSSLLRLDPRESHEFRICCGVETYDFAQKLAEFAGVFSEEIFFYQLCETREIPAECQ